MISRRMGLSQTTGSNSSRRANDTNELELPSLPQFLTVDSGLQTIHPKRIESSWATVAGAEVAGVARVVSAPRVTERGESEDEILQRIRGLVSQRREGVVVDIANVIDSPASAPGSYVREETIDVNGAYHLRGTIWPAFQKEALQGERSWR
jgi:hypothetical protein